MSHVPYYEQEEHVSFMTPTVKIKATPMQIVNEYHEKMAASETMKSDGGPSSYYDQPYASWQTTNDQMEWLAENKWGKYSIHLKDVFKGLCRWGEKEGTDVVYDTKKGIYYFCRVLRMMRGKEAVREYLQGLLDDPQFK